MQENRSSNPPVVTGICDPNTSWARHNRSLKLGSKLKYLNCNSCFNKFWHLKYILVFIRSRSCILPCTYFLSPYVWLLHSFQHAIRNCRIMVLRLSQSMIIKVQGWWDEAYFVVIQFFISYLHLCQIKIKKFRAFCSLNALKHQQILRPTESFLLQGCIFEFIAYLVNDNEQTIRNLYMFQNYESQNNSSLNLIAATIIYLKGCLLIAVKFGNHK